MLPLILLTAICLLFAGCQPRDTTTIGNWCAEDTNTFRHSEPEGYEWKKQCECRVGISSVRQLSDDTRPKCRNCGTPWKLVQKYKVITFPVVEVYQTEFDGREWRRVE